MNTWQRKLLNWYNKHKRDLPWRQTKDPYAIWVSEIMLQQTTVEAVIPYYERFLKTFPTIHALAQAEEEDVLKMWSGLGYYSRARNLQKAAQVLTDPLLGMKGKLPQNVEDLIQLPGIGRYTAGAIASIAFGQRAPILDGNVMRVLSRLYKIPEDPKSTQGQKVFWKKAEEILKFVGAGFPRPKTGQIQGAGTAPLPYGDFNQALMELGATVCKPIIGPMRPIGPIRPIKPIGPICPIGPMCPISSHCAANQDGVVGDFPKLAKRVASVEVKLSAAILQKGEKILVVRRPKKGLLKGMWEIPMTEGGVEALIGLISPIGLIGPMKPIGPIRHSVLNRRLTITPYHGLVKKQLSPPCDHLWIHPDEIKNLPTSSMNKKILKKFF